MKETDGQRERVKGERDGAERERESGKRGRKLKGARGGRKRGRERDGDTARHAERCYTFHNFLFGLRAE